MRTLLLILALIIVSCKGQKKENNQTEKPEFEKIITSEFELIKSEKQNGLLILFPCFPCDAKNTFSEFKISEISIQNGISVLAMNFNQRLFLYPSEKQELAEQLEKIVTENNLPTQNIVIGGFSSGGNVSLLISDYLVERKSHVQPKAVFVVDSPVDLLALYQTAQKNLKMNFSEPAIQEATWIKSFFDKEFGKPENGIDKYEQYSPFTLKTQNTENLSNLKNLKIRAYTEPDVKWWQENRKNDYQDLNAYYLKRLSEKLKMEFGSENIELIETENKGYRKNGERHPHSWAIVNQKELIKWIRK